MVMYDETNTNSMESFFKNGEQKKERSVAGDLCGIGGDSATVVVEESVLIIRLAREIG